MTTQVRSPCGVRRCIVGNRILTHMVNGLQPQGGLSCAAMCFLFARTLPCNSIPSFIRKPRLPKPRSITSRTLLKKIVTEISMAPSRNTPRQSPQLPFRYCGKAPPGPCNLVLDPDESIERQNITRRSIRLRPTLTTIVDWLRYQKGDYLGALEDYNAAIRSGRVSLSPT